MLLKLLLTTIAANALQGGAFVEQERFPGTIAFTLTGSQTRCTAVHVAPQIFLTAAHCFDHYKNDGKIEFVANEMGPDKEPRIVTFSHRLVRAPVIQPDYYVTDGLWGSIKRKFFGENPDLALFKTIEDLGDLSIAKVESTDFHVGLPLLVGGFGPSDPNAKCDPACSIRMDSQKVTEVTKREILVNAAFTNGDDGGPAYAIRPGGKLAVVAINQSGSRLSMIDHAWFRANLIRLEEGRK